MNKERVRQLITRHLKRTSGWNYDSLYHQLFRLNVWQSAKVIAVTMSTGIEIPTGPIIERAWREHKITGVPKVGPHRQMRFYRYSKGSRLRPDHFGILEPVDNDVLAKDQIDLIVVPGLAFTKSGFRLGFGGGYYDRYLRDYHGGTVALARDCQLFDQPPWPVGRYDVPVDRVISTHA